MDWFGQSQVFREEEREKATRRKVREGKGKEEEGREEKGELAAYSVNDFPAFCRNR